MAARTRTFARVCLLYGLVALAQGVAFAEATIRVSGVPEDLSFPVPAGRNAVVTATIVGGEAEAVWLSRDRDSQARFMLVAVGNGEYQVNLADKELSAMLRAAGGDGQFRIFARTPDGNVVASIPIRYAAATPMALPPHIFVHVDGKREEVGPADRYERLDDYALLARVSGPGLWVGPGQVPPGTLGRHWPTATFWFSPAHVEKLEVDFEEDSAGGAAEARIGDERFPLRATKADNVLELAVTPEIQKAWRAARTVTLVCTSGSREVMRVFLKALPERLALPEGEATLTIVQRHMKAVPGSDDYLRVYVDDITAGQVLVSVSTADGRKLVDQKSLKEGDEATFRVGAAEYGLTVQKLVNFLVGDDYGEFKVAPAKGPVIDEEAERGKIERLIQAVQQSDIVFIREGRGYSPAQAAEHLRDKYETARSEVKTLDAFIDNVASASWTTGKPYLVRLPDGREMPAGQWLRQQPVDEPPAMPEKAAAQAPSAEPSTPG